MPLGTGFSLRERTSESLCPGKRIGRGNNVLPILFIDTRVGANDNKNGERKRSDPDPTPYHTNNHCVCNPYRWDQDNNLCSSPEEKNMGLFILIPFSTLPSFDKVAKKVATFSLLPNPVKIMASYQNFAKILAFGKVFFLHQNRQALW